MDVNEPIKNPQLLETLARLKSNYGYQSEYKFFKELVSAHFLTPITEDSLEGYVKEISTLEKGSTIKFIHLSDGNGRNYLPVFTDWDELRKWNNTENVKTLILSFEDYKTLIFSDKSTLVGFVLNPFGQNIIFDKELIQMWKR